MANEFDYSQLIDDYLKGSISESDKKLFESRLENDPAFKGEFEFQKDVFTVIRNTRISQLKSLLSTVQVPWYYMISTGWKVAITAGVISLAGFSSYYLYHNTQESKHEITIELKSTDIHSKASPEKLTVPAVKEKISPAESTENKETDKTQISKENEAIFSYQGDR